MSFRALDVNWYASPRNCADVDVIVTTLLEKTLNGKVAINDIHSHFACFCVAGKLFTIDSKAKFLTLVSLNTENSRHLSKFVQLQWHRTVLHLG